MQSNTLRWPLAVLCLCSLPSMANEPIDEITVTADYRQRSLSDIAGSVSVLDARTIEQAAVQHFEELIATVPNMNWSGDGHRARYLQIRGVGELEQYQGAPNPSVGFIIDDIDFSGIGTVATLFDMESVEVLRGPQGSRYGANALGGLVYLRSMTPGTDRDSRVTVTVGDDALRAAGVAFGGELNGRATGAFRISAHHHRSDGFRRNAALPSSSTNERNETSVRARVATQLGSADAQLALLYADIDNGYDAFALDNSLTTLSDKPGRDAQRSLGASLRLDWQIDNGIDITAVSALADSDVEFSFDADWGNTASWLPYTYDYFSASNRDRRTLSQEVRATGDNWLSGIYVLHLDESLKTRDTGAYFDPFFDFADALDARFDSTFESTNVAAFGQYDIETGAATRLSTGLRVEHRRTDYADSDGLRAGPDETLWGGEISLVHQVDASRSVYVTVSRGFKAGGFNLGQVPELWRSFDAEAMWTLETGLRTRLLNNALALNLSVFHNWRDAQQVRASFQLIENDPASFGFASVNVNGARGYGVEAELQWQFNERLAVYLNAADLRGGFDRSTDPFPNLSGRAQAHAPQYTLAAGLSYRHPQGFFARIDASARDEFFFDVSHNQRSEAYAIANARLGWDLPRWQFAVWARNVFDTDYAVRGFFFGNEPPDFPATLYTRSGDPRQLGVTAEWRF